MNDNDGTEHSLLVRTLSGFEALFAFAGESDRKRVHGNLQGSDCLFVVFDTPTHRVALRRSNLSFWQFLFDPAFHRIERSSHAMIGATEATETEEAQPLRFWLIGGGPPLTFGVDYDDPPEVGEIDPDRTPMAALFCDFEIYDSEDDLFCFIDEDGEQAFVRASHVIVASIPLNYLNGVLDDE